MPNQEAITLYDDDDSNHHIDDDTVWTYNGCNFKRITKKEADGSIVELRNGGVLSCPICPEIGVMTTLSNLIGHLVAKNHAQRFYHLWSLRGSGNSNAEPMLLFQDNWEIANHLKILRSKRLEKIDRVVVAQGEYTWGRLKNRFNYIAEGNQNGVQAIHPGQFFMPEFDMLHKFKGIDNHVGGPEWSRMQPHQDRLLGTRTYHSNRGTSSFRTSGQQIVTSVFKQAKEKMTGVKGPLSEIIDNPRKRRAPEEENEQAAISKIPKRPYICDDSDVRTDQAANKKDKQPVNYASPKVTDTLGIQFPWTDEQIAQARALKAKVANSEELTPEEDEIHKNFQQLCFLLDTFQGMENGESSGTHTL
ncbi:uncharacterized protein DFL_008904 [Arthrobotrys flagrans]|uniref:Uncharacterized protein n=1 Tax=Arthrobotrys flagrans TaxID=97331 RepID=A0A436ZQE1_ARTFL|nr:hypothetical protein DFL_008904 [Arthrobotrys flagrans]